MRRFGAACMLTVLAVSLVTVAGCQKKIEVQSGKRTLCTYGEVVSNDIQTVSVSADRAGAYRVETVTITCDRHRKLEALYSEAQADITGGDLASAKIKLLQVVASDSVFRKAKQQLSATVIGNLTEMRLLPTKHLLVIKQRTFQKGAALGIRWIPS